MELLLFCMVHLGKILRKTEESLKFLVFFQLNCMCFSLCILLGSFSATEQAHPVPSKTTSPELFHLKFTFCFFLLLFWLG